MRDTDGKSGQGYMGTEKKKKKNILKRIIQENKNRPNEYKNAGIQDTVQHIRACIYMYNIRYVYTLQ